MSIHHLLVFGIFLVSPNVLCSGFLGRASSSSTSFGGIESRQFRKALSRLQASGYHDHKDEVMISSSAEAADVADGLGPGADIKSPLNKLVDVNLERQSVVYEVTLGRDMGIDIVQDDKVKCAVVGEVYPGSRAEEMGILKGDIIVSTSATAGGSLWSHESATSVKSALNTRFVMNPTVIMRLERSLSDIPDEIESQLYVPYLFNVRLKRPIGLHVVEGPNKSVIVQYIKPELGASRSKRVEIGDQIVAMSASWGDNMWEVNSVESFVVGVKMRTTSLLTFKMKRMVPLKLYTGQATTKQKYQQKREEKKAEQDLNRINLSGSLHDQLSDVKGIVELEQVLSLVKSQGKLSQVSINQIMTTALRLEKPDFALDVFEEAFGFIYDPKDPAKQILNAIDRDQSQLDIRADEEGYIKSRKVRKSKMTPTPILQPNNFVCTTAVKAFGRSRHQDGVDRALALIPWLESESDEKADIFLLTSVLYVCAKRKRVKETEHLFWKEIPNRGLMYTVATTNSLMYMYARTNRPDDALKVYELTKRIGLTCTVVTYGVLIKALLRSGRKALQETSFEILRSLPELNISPGVEIYNQFFEHYARTHDYRKVKLILRLMSESRPKTKPDAISYGHLIHCFAESKKPRSALSVYHQMLKRKIAPSSYTYMGILKALSHMRDGLSCVQVIGEMREKGIVPSKKHYAMTMFACITSNQCMLAESIYAMYIRLGNRPDTALYTLKLRALLQQDKWTEGIQLFNGMMSGKEAARPNLQTCNILLQYQALDGRHNEARQTLDIVLGMKQEQNTPNVLADTYKALSFALGHYSNHVQTMQKEDQIFQTGGVQGSGAQLDMRDTNLSYSSAKLLAKPDTHALQFLVSCVEHISNGGRVQGDFYIQLFRAVVLQNQPQLANRLLKLREEDRIFLKDIDLERSKQIEELATRSLKG